MSKIDFNPTTFSSRLTEINAALEKKDKWVTDSLEVVNKDNGFVRFIKVIILPLARFFGADPFTHVRANAVALVIIGEYQKHQAELSEEDKKRTYEILDRLNQKTKNKYDVIFAVFLPSIDKSMGPSDQKPASYTDSGVKGTQAFKPPQAPPVASFEEFLKSNTMDRDTHAALGEMQGSKKDLLNDVFDKDTRVKTTDINHIVKIFNNPIVTIGLSNLTMEIDAFIDVLNQTDNDETELDVEDESLLYGVETHPILGEFYKEFPTIPAEKRAEWIDQTVNYLEEVMEGISKAKKKKVGNKQDSIKSMQEHQAYCAQVEKQKKLEKHLQEQERLRKEIEIDPTTINTKIKLKQFKFFLHLPENAIDFRKYDEVVEEVNNWIDNGDLTDSEMLEKHNILKKIAGNWQTVAR